jgi:hypothetical protein
MGRALADFGLAQSQGVHETADMILVVTDAETFLDGLRETGRGPTIVGETELHGAAGVEAYNFGLLVLGEPAGATRSPTSTQTFYAFVVQGALPA